ncbi:type IV conjugative transfer system protein TraL [Legionella sp.]|uniref:type IV conjugative transfer system protein TraL n=1 Tax=Legionella sp. TaxID=459 RepID=UPI00321FB7B2
MSRAVYRFFNHLDAPKRVFSLTVDELSLAVIGLALLVMSNHKLMLALLSMLLLTCLRRLKKEPDPKVLLILAYWYLPHGLTKYFLPKLPASYLQVWVA